MAHNRSCSRIGSSRATRPPHKRNTNDDEDQCPFHFALVRIQNGAYSGQKLTRLVNTNTAARIISAIPTVQGMAPEKYR